MFSDEIYAQNIAALYLLRDTINKTYPKGHFVAVAQGKVVADAPRLEELLNKLEEMGIDPQQTIGEEVGYEPPSPSAFTGILAHLAQARAQRG